MWGRSRLILATLKPTHFAQLSIGGPQTTSHKRPSSRCIGFSQSFCPLGMQACWLADRAGCRLQVISSDGLGGPGGLAGRRAGVTTDSTPKTCRATYLPRES